MTTARWDQSVPLLQHDCNCITVRGKEQEAREGEQLMGNKHHPCTGLWMGGHTCSWLDLDAQTAKPAQLLGHAQHSCHVQN